MQIQTVDLRAKQNYKRSQSEASRHNWDAPKRRLVQQLGIRLCFSQSAFKSARFLTVSFGDLQPTPVPV